MRHLRFTILLLLVSLCVRAESYKTVNVKGEYHMSDNDNITPAQAKVLAQEDAKRKALIEVCGQQISIFEQVESSTKIGEVFTSVTSSEVNGEIGGFQIIKEEITTNGSLFIFSCEASVEVKKGIKRDNSFVANVTGLKTLYFDGEVMTFMVEPSKDCYLNVFVYENLEKVNMLYPNNRELSKKLNAHVNEFFPIDDDGKYTVEKDTEKPSEINKIVFLFTKSEYVPPKFTHNKDGDKVNDVYIDHDDFLKWITSIPSDRKFIYTTTFEIKKKNE